MLACSNRAVRPAIEGSVFMSFCALLGASVYTERLCTRSVFVLACLNRAVRPAIKGSGFRSYCAVLGASVYMHGAFLCLHARIVQFVL